MSVSIQTIDFTKAIAKGPRIRTAANAALCGAILQSTADLVPYNTGKLRGSGETETNYTGGQVSWGNSDVKYARVQYYSYPHKRRDKQPGATCFWFDVAMQKHMPEWVKAAVQAAKQVCDE